MHTQIQSGLSNHINKLQEILNSQEYEDFSSLTRRTLSLSATITYCYTFNNPTQTLPIPNLLTRILETTTPPKMIPLTPHLLFMLTCYILYLTTPAILYFTCKLTNNITDHLYNTLFKILDSFPQVLFSMLNMINHFYRIAAEKQVEAEVEAKIN